MHPECISLKRVQPDLALGPITLKTFGLAFALAFIAVGALAARRFKELGKPEDWAYEIVFAALVGGLLGSRLYYLVQNYDAVRHDLLGNLFSGSGLVWYGGVLGGALGVVLWARWRGFLSLGLLDIAAPALALGYAIGRIGCQVSGTATTAIPSDLPWAMAYPHGTVPTPPGVDGAPDPDLRDAGDGADRAGGCGATATASPRGSSSPGTSCCRGSSACSSSSSAATAEIVAGLTGRSSSRSA